MAITDDEVMRRVHRKGGTMRFPSHRHKSLRGRKDIPTSGQLKRMIKEGRLIGATISVSPIDGPNGGSRPQDVYLEVSLPNKTIKLVNIKGIL